MWQENWFIEKYKCISRQETLYRVLKIHLKAQPNNIGLNLRKDGYVNTKN